MSTNTRYARRFGHRFAAVALAFGSLSLTQIPALAADAPVGEGVGKVNSLIDNFIPHEDPVADGITRTTYSLKEEGEDDRVVRVVYIDPDLGGISLSSTVGKSVSEREKTTDMLKTVGTGTKQPQPYVGVNGGFSVPKKGQDAASVLIEEELSVPTGATVQGDVVQGVSCSNPNSKSESVVLQHGRPYISKVKTELRLTASDGASREVDAANRYAGWVPTCQQGDDDRLIPSRVVVTEVDDKKVETDVYLDEFGRDILNGKYFFEDDSEIIVFTSEYGATTPQANHSNFVKADNAAGVEVAVNAAGVVVAVDNTLGGMAIPAGGRVFQGIGNQVAGQRDPALNKVDVAGGGEKWLREHAVVGSTLSYTQKVTDAFGELPLDPAHPSIDVVNGTHLLMRDGVVQTPEAQTPANDPRTALGIDGYGRTLLVTVTGGERSNPPRNGVGMFDLAKIMQDLGAIDALNLDGGGSTTFVVEGAVRNVLSDATGERRVYDSVYAGHGGYGLK